VRSFLRRYRTPVLIFGVALAVRLIYALALRPFLGDVPDSDAPVYIADAHTLLAGGGYHTVPILTNWPGVRFGFHPPAYSYFVAGCFRLFGDSLLPLFVLQSVLGALTCVGLSEIGRDFFGRRAGVAAGVVAALTPELVRYPSAVLSETLFLFLVVAALWAAVHAARRGAPWPMVAIVGGLIGLGTLTRELALVLGVIPVGLIVLRGNPARRLWPALPAAALVLLPWVLHTRKVFGQAEIGGLNRWENIYYGFGPGATVWRSAGPLLDINYVPSPPPSPVGAVEVQADHEYHLAAMTAIESDPTRAVRLFALRSLASLDPFPEDWKATTTLRRAVHVTWGAAVALLELLALVGIYAARRRRVEVALVVTGMALVLASIGLTFVLTRFRVQLLPELVLLAGAGLASLLPRRPAFVRVVPAPAPVALPAAPQLVGVIAAPAAPAEGRQ
jgi:4-amino-4-deoxy-L-arabinose transferase-like glycosyltransferase